VSIVTPNHLHFEPARLALESGFHVIIDKPISLTLAEARQLKKSVAKSKLILALTHTYTGYPMVKEARQLIQKGALGKCEKCMLNMHKAGSPQKLKKKISKPFGALIQAFRFGGTIGDIGTHAANLAEYISGNKITEVCAELNSVLKSRVLDDDGAMLVHFENEAAE